MTIELWPGLLRLLVALLIGMLIGLDRERKASERSFDEFAGIRTFPLIAITGCIPMLIAPPAGPILLAIAFLAMGAVTMLAYRQAAVAGNIGATTEVAAIATFLLGALAGSGGLLFAGGAGIVVAVLLASKGPLERFSAAMTREEMAAMLQMAVISVIILPVLPDAGYGPWGVLNPREIWMVVVLVAGLSLAAFIAVRLLGERKGLAATGAIGGLVSSTAITVSMADRSKEAENVAVAAAAAAILASTVMALRIGVLAGLIASDVLPRLLPALIAMAIVGGVFAWIAAKRASSGETGAAPLRNPFRLRQAITFALLYAAIVLVVRAAEEYLAPSALFAVAALSAVMDVDAITIAFAKRGPEADGWRTIAAGITLAAVVNTLVKLGIGVSRGGAAFRRWMALALGSMASAGAVAGTVIYLGQ